MANKYTYFIVLQGNIGDGWFDLVSYDKSQPGYYRELIQDRRDYIENTNYALRTINRRELNTQIHHV